MTYTLTLKNTLTNAYTYENVCVIDRLPGVDDTGAYSQRPRGSQWSLATITNVTTNVSGAKIQYSNKASLDTPDWMGDDTAEHHAGEIITYHIGMQNFNTSEKQNIKVTDQLNRLLEFQEGTLQLHVINNDGTDTVTPITSYALNNGALEITNLTIPGREENRPEVPVHTHMLNLM